jgi:hypothetical protein
MEHCSLANRWLKRDENLVLEAIQKMVPAIHLSFHPSIPSPYERYKRREQEMKYKHTVLSVYQRRSNLLQRREGNEK